MAKFKGFKSADLITEDELKRIVISLWGNTGVGKSFFGLTCPPPIFLFNYEPTGLSAAMRAASNIGYCDLDEVYPIDVMRDVFGDKLPTQASAKEKQEVYTYTHDVLHEVFKERADYELGEKGTIVMDTMSTFWKYLREATMEEIVKKREAQKKPLFQFDHGVANQALEVLVKALTASNFNVVFLGNSQKKYENNAWTGTYEYQGSDRLSTWVDFHGQLIPPVVDKKTKKVRSEAYIKIEKCRVDRELVGFKINDPSYDMVINELQEQINNQ